MAKHCSFKITHVLAVYDNLYRYYVALLGQFNVHTGGLKPDSFHLFYRY